MMKIYGNIASPYVRKVLAALAMKQLPFERIEQMPFMNDKEYQKISPLGKIPAMQHDDLTVSDSTVICEYLEEVFPDTAIYPSNPQDKARARWYEELGGGRVTELASGIFFQRFMRPLAFKQEPDEELVGKIINKQLPPVLDYLESVMPEQGFLFGDFLIADLALVSGFVNAGYANYQIDGERWPKLASFYQRVCEHEIVAPLLAAEAKQFGM